MDYSEMIDDTRASVLYEKQCSRVSDINEHLPVLRRYADECDHITEMGVRWVVSTSAFLMGKPKKLVSIDIVNPSVYEVEEGKQNLEDVIEGAKELEVDFQFIEADTRNIEIEETDLLFIDTEHTYEQLKKELEVHSGKVRKYMIFHDTVTYGRVGMNGEQMGLMDAIEEFMETNNEWNILEHHENNNGLLILSKGFMWGDDIR